MPTCAHCGKTISPDKRLLVSGIIFDFENAKGRITDKGLLAAVFGRDKRTFANARSSAPVAEVRTALNHLPTRRLQEISSSYSVGASGARWLY